jgi:hypothetical protein
MTTLLGDHNSIQEYLNTKQYNPTIPLEKNIFEWELALQYGIEYFKYMQSESLITQQSIIKDRKLIIICGVPEEMVEYIELFCQLDKEYKEHIINNSILRKDLNWRGFWIKATGGDFSIFIHWIKYGIKNPICKTKNFNDTYLEEHLNIKYIPYAVRVSQDIFQKYYNK